MKLTLTQVVKKFGPVQKLSNAESHRLAAEGDALRILTIHGEDIPWEDAPEDERPSIEELEDMGESPETYDVYVMEGRPGHSIVNVEARLLCAKPLPEDLEVEVDDLSVAG